jgi:1,4-dihydroxy-2-naphthoate octaprenyltransferase
MREAILHISEFIAYSNLFISASSYYFTLYCCESLHISSDKTKLYALIVALSVFFIYGLQRLYFVKSKPALTPRQHWYKRFFNPMAFMVGASALSILPLLFLFPFKLALYFALPAVISLVYYLGPLPLRKVFAIKGFVIGLVWAACCVVIPFYIFQPQISAGKMFLLATAAFFFVAALCIPFDIRDIHEDRPKKIKSIPVVLGVRMSIVTGIALAVLFGVLICLANFEANVILAAVVTSAITIFAVGFSTPERSKFYFSLLVDGLLFAPFLSLRLFQLSE